MLTDSQLLEQLNLAQNNPRIWDVIERRVCEAIYELGFQGAKDMPLWVLQELITGPKDWLQHRCCGQKISNLPAFEARLRSELASLTCIDRALPHLMRKRARKWMDKINPHLLEESLKASTLDFGCGDGELMLFLYTSGIKVSGADVQDWRRPPTDRLPFYKIIGQCTKLWSKSFDQVLAMTVLNHSHDPDATLAEIFRLAQRRVIIMESVLDGKPDTPEREMSFLVTLWIDWFYNRVIHYNAKAEGKMPMTGNYDTRSGWMKRIKDLTSFRPLAVVDYGVFQWLNPAHHVLLVYLFE